MPPTNLVCPACESKAVKAHSIGRVPQKSEYLPSDYQLMVCSHCNLWFKDNIPSVTQLKQHYCDLNIDTSPWNYSDRGPHEQHLDTVLSTLPDQAKVLDIGCWTGRLLSYHFPRLQVYGIEPNSAAAHISEQSGLKILASEVTTELARFGLFDCITMVDVFEHLPNPIDTIKILISVLAVGGKILIVTGQTDCIPVWIIGSSYWYFTCPDHMIFLNQKFCDWLQQNFQNTNVSYQTIRHFPFHIRRFFYELVWLIAWRFGSPHNSLPKLALHKLPVLSRLDRLREPLVCTTWKDHALLKIQV